MTAEKTHLAKAQLKEMDSRFEDVKPGGTIVEVQFNPETLKVTFTNQVVQHPNAADQQFVGTGSTKLSIALWFDVTGELPTSQAGVDDVRRLTQQVAYFITPIKNPNGDDYIPPAVRFAWGSFQFDGIVESMEENLDFFSPDGRPLRANVTMSMSRPRIELVPPQPTGAPPSPANLPSGAPPGTRQLTSTPAGATLQGLADSLGGGASWQSIATANNIENPRLLAPGRLVDLSVRTR